MLNDNLYIQVEGDENINNLIITHHDDRDFIATPTPYSVPTSNPSAYVMDLRIPPTAPVEGVVAWSNTNAPILNQTVLQTLTQDEMDTLGTSLVAQASILGKHCFPILRFNDALTVSRGNASAYALLATMLDYMVSVSVDNTKKAKLENTSVIAKIMFNNCIALPANPTTSVQVVPYYFIGDSVIAYADLENDSFFTPFFTNEATDEDKAQLLDSINAYVTEPA